MQKYFEHIDSTSLLKIFIISSLVSLMSIFILIYFLSNNISAKYNIKEAEHAVINISRGLLGIEREVLFSLGLEGTAPLSVTPEDFQDLDNRMNKYLSAFDVLKIKVFSINGEIIYSTDHTIIGQKDSKNKALISALNGEVVSEQKKKEEMSDLKGEKRFKVDLIETYIPVKDENNEIIGVFEIYLDIGKYQKNISEFSFSYFAVVTISLISVFGFLFVIMKLGANRLRKQEEYLRDSEKRFRSVVESANDAIICIDSRGEVIFWNKASGNIFGYLADEIVGKSVILIIPERLREAHKKAMKRANKGESRVIRQTIELIGLKKDGSEFPLEMSLSMWKSENETYFTAVIRDITERMQAMEKLEIAKNDAEAANRTKSEFLANMSHEIRTPMNGIIGMTELLKDTELTNDQREEYFDMLGTSTDNMMLIINDILDISKIEAGKIDFENIDFNLHSTFSEITETHNVKVQQKGLGLIYNVSPKVPNIILGDPGRLRQVLINIVGNAIKFTERGEIVVSLEVESQTEDEVILHFAVSDTGIGIPEDKRKLIFGAFTQVDGSSTRKYGGTGLGLSISSKLVEMMKGKIWVESEVGKGSTFHFTARFGIASELEKQELPEEVVDFDYESSDNQTKNEDRQKVYVLLAEDNMVNQKLAVRILEKEGYAVEVANDGEEALEGLKKEHFDIVLMDVQMPKMDGIEATQAIRNSKDNAFNPEIPIIAVTAHAFEEDKERCLKAGMNSCVTKPFNKKELCKEIERLVQAENITS